MQLKFLWLQLFAGEGGAAGDGGGSAAGGEGATTNSGVTPEAAVPETRADRLAKLGVPKDKLNRRAYQKAVNEPQSAQTAPEQDAAAADEAGQEPPEPKKPTFEEIMQDPEYNQAMQGIVAKRVAKSKQAEAALEALRPALELLAKDNNIDIDGEGFDYSVLNQAIVDNDSFYEDKAIELGVSVEVAKQIEQAERIRAQEEQRQQMTIEQQKIQNHLNNLQEQAVALKAKFPDFDLDRELDNPAFVRMTAPDSLLTVEDAYFAVHREDILKAVKSTTTQQISNAIQAGQRRPAEGGVAKTSNASTTTFDWHNASKEQREALKKDIRSAAARGEKIKPGYYR